MSFSNTVIVGTVIYGSGAQTALEKELDLLLTIEQYKELFRQDTNDRFGVENARVIMMERVSFTDGSMTKHVLYEAKNKKL